MFLLENNNDNDNNNINNNNNNNDNNNDNDNNYNDNNNYNNNDNYRSSNNNDNNDNRGGNNSNNNNYTCYNKTFPVRRTNGSVIPHRSWDAVGESESRAVKYPSIGVFFRGCCSDHRWHDDYVYDSS
jgi:hypothetical protein